MSKESYALRCFQLMAHHLLLIFVWPISVSIE